jgi:peptidyl-prolyl cis-trans isomerase D
MFTKYSTLISKGLYSTKQEAINELNNTNKKVDFSFVAQNINTIPDSLITVETSDLKNYYDNHKNEFKQEASRSMEYITFDVIASEADKIAAEEWINNFKNDFANTDNDKEFASINSELAFGNGYLKKDELPAELKDVMFDAEEGFMHGPYFKDEAYLLAKLSEVKFIPDSVRAKHILLQPTQTQDANQIFAIADSLIELLENGKSFTALSDEFSADKASNEKGGDLGWFRANQALSPAFADTCINAKTGEFKLVASQYGLHIVQVTNKAKNEKKVRVSILGRKLEPTSETYQKTYAQASKFAGNNHSYEEFIQAIEEQGLTKKIASNVKEADQQLAGLDNPRELIRSIYSTDNQNIITSQNNPIFELGDRYVIGFVSEVKEEGFATMEQVNILLTVQAKKLKKAEYLANKFNEAIQENNDLDFIASKLNTEVLEANDINFRSYTVPNLGAEPKLVAVATCVEPNYITAPIKGDNNVFVLRVNSITEDDIINVDLQQQQNLMFYQNRANYEAFEALKETANIIDKRSKFY